MSNDSMLRVDLDGAAMFVQHPASDTNLDWQMRYGSAEAVRYPAATLLESYESLLDPNMRLGEAIRRIRLARKAYREAIAAAKEEARHGNP